MDKTSLVKSSWWVLRDILLKFDVMCVSYGVLLVFSLFSYSM